MTVIFHSDAATVPVSGAVTLPADTHSWDQFSSDPTTFAVAFDPLEPATGGLNNIEEDRRDAYALIEGKSGPLQYEAGVRWENTKVRIADLDANTTSSIDYDFLLPSASVKLDLGRGRLTASVARTMRRPRFDYISPALLEAELGDNDLLGNPALKPETAWGGDLGYDHRIGTTGVIGVNLFYRKITNLVEIADTGVEGSEGDGTFVLQPQNTGSGKVCAM